MNRKLQFLEDKILQFCFYLSILAFSGNFLNAQTCNSDTTNPNAYGSGSWIGHVYDHNGTSNPVTMPFATYKGYTTEIETINRNWGSSKPDCAGGNDNFAVRYRMNKTFAPGNYTFTIGADDGVRLSIDGGITWILSDWSDHGYRTTSVRVPMSGNYNLVLEYYEKTGGAQVSFSYTTVATTNYSMPSANTTSIITTCAGKLLDSGGSAGNYSDSEDRSVIIKPGTAGNFVQIDGSITAEGGYDYLTIYDGEGTTGTVLWGGAPHGSGTACSTFAVPTVVSSTGSLTVRFRSDGSSNCSGFNLNINCLAPCTGTPTAGTTVLTPSTGAPSSAFVATVTGGSSSPGLSYQWQIADALAGPYTDIATQTGASANLNAVPLPGTTKYYRRKTTCNSSGLSSVSIGVPFTTTTPTYCAPTSGSKMNLYISSFRFVGTLNDPPLTANVTGGDGYKDYTTLAPIAEQPDGSVINIEAISLGSVNSANGNWKAWVDWNGDGDFIDLGEEVYSLTDYFTNALTFGFIIPPGQTPGKYRLRIKVNYDGTTITPCSAFTNGEVEDYSFLVKYNCPVKVDAVNITPADGHRCGTGTVNLSASGNGTNYKWYTTLTGGTAVFTGSNFTTSSLSTTTVYYVTAVNGTCESAYRIPVTARIDPEPVVNITVPAPICGTGFSGAQLTSSGDQYVDTIIDEKEFIEDATSLGLFEINTTFDTGYYTNGNGNWKNRPSPWIPPVGPYAGLSPALSSGYFGGNYAAIVTDISRTNSILNSLTLKTGKSLINFQDLMLDFDLYYFSITTDPLRGYLKIQYSMDNGGSWNTLETVTTIQGNPNVWAKKSYAIPGPYTATQFKIRFLLFSYADGTEGWKESIAAVDNIKVYGNKPITTGFVWSGPPSMLYDATCTTLIGSTPTNSICIKPSASQIENDSSWNITATANFANGCPATKTITVQNDTKTWDNAGNNWNTNNWKPGGAGVPPTGSKCVIVKTPLIIQAGTNGLAKNVRVESTGKLTIRPDASLTVTDQFINQASVNDVILESDSNLKQINDNPTPANSGSITARRNIKFRSSTTRDEYNYLISPVTGQSLKTLYPGVPTTSTYPYILYHNESNNFFYNSSGAYIPGRGLAVKEPSVAHVPANNKDAEFKGPLANGVITYPLAFTNSSLGYNLVGNPYASNIDLKALYTLNSANISSTFYFWDNGANNVYVQEGSNYKGRAYAVYNAVSDMGNEAGFILPTSTIIGTKKPNNIAKVAQGFMVKTTSGGKTLTFNNSVRTVDNTGVKFFSKGAASEANRYWLQLISPTNAVNTIGVVYFEEGSTAYGMDDSELNVSSSDMFYSLAEDHQLQIEGRPKFVNTDKIVLGSNYFATGNYTIALAENEGVFANGQNIYLKDKQTGIVTNLSQGAYTFAATAGASTGRFEIVYLPEAVLATDAATKENLVVYKDGNNFVVKAQSKKITDLELFDAAGRLMRSFRPNSFKTIIPADQLLNGVYILKINQNGEITTKKVIR